MKQEKHYFKRSMSLLVCLMLFFSSGNCSQNTDPKSTQVTSATIKKENQTETYYLNEHFSPYSEKNFLGFEKSSWVREEKPEFIMIHFMSGVTVDKNNPYDKDLIRNIFYDYEIGINYVIDRNGVIECFLPENRAAWHAGAGEWNNNPKYTNKMNKFSIGIEILAIGSVGDMEQYLSKSEYASLNTDYIGFTDEQYESLGILLKDICDRQKIPYNREHIIGHEEYNPLKTDPGELFDWNKIGL